MKISDVQFLIWDILIHKLKIKKGLSFNSSGELNMKMGINDFSAKDVINKLNAKELEKIFKIFWRRERSKKNCKSKLCKKEK